MDGSFKTHKVPKVVKDVTGLGFLSKLLKKLAFGYVSSRP